MHQLFHKVPIICPMMEYSTLHLPIIIIIIQQLEQNPLQRGKTHKLSLIFVIVKPKVINKIKYLPNIGFNFQHVDYSPHNFQRGANKLNSQGFKPGLAGSSFFFFRTDNTKGASYL